MKKGIYYKYLEDMRPLTLSDEDEDECRVCMVVAAVLEIDFALTILCLRELTSQLLLYMLTIIIY